MFTKLQELCLAETKHIIKNDDFIFHDAGSNILGIAHCDTVFDDDPRKNFYFQNEYYIFSPKLDDRAGVFTLLYYLPQKYPNIKYDILLTTNEEKGCSTAENFLSNKQYNWMFEFDRKGTGAVLYNYEYLINWEEAVDSIFKIQHGSYSDISSLTHLGCCGVNVGTGYYNAHSVSCFLMKDNYKNQINRFANFYYHNKNKHYAYNEDSALSYWEEQEFLLYNQNYSEKGSMIDEYQIKYHEI